METKIHSIDAIKGYELGANDGGIGKTKDLFFDDQSWVIRYLLADTHKWLPSRKVLISPISVGSIDPLTRTIYINLSKKEIKESPPLDSDAPVSRQYEAVFNKHYDWVNYWGGASLWGIDMYPRTLGLKKELSEIEKISEGETNLRSAEEVTGYRIHTRDGDIGHIEDFLMVEDTWLIRYLVIDTSNWIPGSKRVIVDPNWVDDVNWADNSVLLKVNKKQVESSPEYDPSMPVERDFEKSIFDHYKFPYYWI